MLKANEKYEATIIDAGLIDDKNGNAQPFMKFQIGTDTLTWFGNTSNDKGMQISAKALKAAGFIGTDFGDLKLPFAVVFNPKPVSITTEEYKGKVRIKWVNGKEAEKKVAQGKVASNKSLFTQKEDIPF
jgi:hypothetical protein